MDNVIEKHLFMFADILRGDKEMIEKYAKWINSMLSNHGLVLDKTGD